MSNRFALLRDNATAWLDLAIANIQLEYPHMPWIMASGPESYKFHREVHPVFFGSFDWHSCVEMYWVAARILRLTPDSVDDAHAVRVIDDLLTPDNIAAETAFLAAHPGFERPYGWGWLLTLQHELDTSDHPRAATWATTLAPLSDAVMDAFAAWLPKMTYPQRIGMHTNTAFGLVLAWDAIAANRPDLLEVVPSRARDWFGEDTDYPVRYEPSGADFLSAGLCEAALMRRVLGPDAFPAWLDAFLPGLAHADPPSLFTPAFVSDAADGQIAHLHGLNLSRAWAFLDLAAALSDDDSRIAPLTDAAQRHADAALPAVSGSHYMVEHWLVAYALLYATA